ncbi:hypothetical protein [Luteolibacter sp. Populi]|uniref:hypothetical protein n=1 Tax=Luteolibacter sp. Populi TaxID=3230487 RepID=UPI003465D3E2
MSKRVVIISLLLCLIGLWGIWDVIASLLAGHLRFNACVLFLHPGCALLLGRPWARKHASWAFGFFYATTGIATFLALAGIGSGTADYFAIVVSLISLAVAMLLHWQLYTRPFDEYLAESPPAS